MQNLRKRTREGAKGINGNAKGVKDAETQRGMKKGCICLLDSFASLRPSRFHSPVLQGILRQVSVRLRSVWRAVRARDCSGLTVLLIAALVLTGLTASAPPHRVRATGAVGVVVRHGDGRVLYAYIPLVGDRVTGAEVLQQAGFPLNVQASSSLGAAVCKIDGEGCDAPKEDCFCKSYGNPAFYWHYYVYTRGPNGAWRTSNTGAGNRMLRDGDIDGWSWTANDPALPSVTLDEIAALVRPAVTAAVTVRVPTPPAVVLPTPVRVATATAMPSTTAPPTDSATAPLPPMITAPLIPPLLPLPTLPMPPPDNPTPRAVIVGPSGTVTAVQPVPPPPANGNGNASDRFGAFVAVAVGALLLLAVVPLGARKRRGAPNLPNPRAPFLEGKGSEPPRRRSFTGNAAPFSRLAPPAPRGKGAGGSGEPTTPSTHAPGSDDNSGDGETHA